MSKGFVGFTLLVASISFGSSIEGIWHVKKSQCSGGKILHLPEQWFDFGKPDEPDNLEIMIRGTDCHETDHGKYLVRPTSIEFNIRESTLAPAKYDPVAKGCGELKHPHVQGEMKARIDGSVLKLEFPSSYLGCALGEVAKLTLKKVYDESSIQATDRVNVLTFNAWTVEVPHVYEISKRIDERLALLPGKISEVGADIITFEEVWRPARKEALIRDLKTLGYPYSLYVDPGKFKVNGLLIVSKYFLDPRAQLLIFSAHTRYDEQFFVYKGALKTRVKVPKAGWADLYVSHLGAVTTVLKNNRPDHFDESHLLAKEHQAQELAAFVKLTRSSETAVLGVDLNTHYNVFENGTYDRDRFTPEYSLMTCAGGIDDSCLAFVDTYRAAHGFTQPPAFTFDTINNTYARNGIFQTEPQGAIDYIFVSPTSRLMTLESSVALTERLTDSNLTLPEFLSDHYGVLTTFLISNPR